MTAVRTDQLEPGMRVQLPDAGVVRTVDHVCPSAWLNDRGDIIFYVYYAEGRTPEWSEGNSAIARSIWNVVQP